MCHCIRKAHLFSCQRLGSCLPSRQLLCGSLCLPERHSGHGQRGCSILALQLALGWVDLVWVEACMPLSCMVGLSPPEELGVVPQMASEVLAELAGVSQQ